MENNPVGQSTDWRIILAETKRDSHLKEKILLSALELMSRKGVVGTTLSEIAAHCEISRGTLYYYYRSKDELIFDINEWNMSRLTDGLLKLLDEFDEAKMEFSQIILEVFKTVSDAQIRGRMHLYLINEAISRNPDLLHKLQNSYKQWFAILEKAFVKLLPDDTDREAAARAIVASLDGMVIQNILSIDRIPLERIVKSMVSKYEK